PWSGAAATEADHGAQAPEEHEMSSRAMDTAGGRAWPAWLTALGVIAVIMTLGSSFPPGDWYEQLAKPTWQPPAWVFAPIWSLIYASLAASLALLLQAPRSVERRRALQLFAVQLVFNVAWTPLFFGLQSPLLAFIDVVCLW